MTTSNLEARASLISELLLYHAVLGRGYISPFPPTKGLTFSSALPVEALSVLAAAETSFRRWHEESIANDRHALEMMEMTPGVISAVTGQDKLAGKKLRERLSRRPHITWKEDQVVKSTLVELMKTHYYGAMTYVDAVGARLAASLGHSSRLASDLGWVTLTEGTTDETLIRANSNGGACIHSLAGTEAIFNYFCSCKDQHLEKLAEKIRETAGGQVGIGTSVLLRGYPGTFSGVSSSTLFSLAVRVFTLGDQEPEKRVKVSFAKDCEAEWRKFLAWKLIDLLDTPELTEWEWKLASNAPASPQTSVLFAARAAMVAAFIQTAEAQPDGPIRMVELQEEHLKLAKETARLIYRESSGQTGYEKRIKNLKHAKDNFITPQKIAIARVALTEAIEAAPGRRLARTQVRNGAAPGATLGLLDELVRTGDIIELNGTEECQMGRTTKAYVLPKDAPRCVEIDAIDEYREAVENFIENPDAFADGEALIIARRLRERAETINHEHMLPAVPLTRMTKAERRLLPKILSLFPESFYARGEAIGEPEPARLMEDDDIPLDVGLNLWVRCRPNGEEFCDWDKAGLLQLSRVWGKQSP